MDEDQLNQTETLTDTKVRIKVPSSTKMAIAVAFLGIAAVAAAGAGMRSSRQVQQPRLPVAEQRAPEKENRLSMADVAYNHALAYAKDARKSMSRSKFGLVLYSSNVFLKDSYKHVKFNPKTESAFVSAMDKASKGDYKELESWFGIVYSGADEKKVIWSLLLEGAMKEKVLANAKFSATYDKTDVGGGIKVLGYHFDPAQLASKPLIPTLWDNLHVLEGVSGDEREGLGGFGGNSVGTMPSGAFSGGGGGISGGFLNALACGDGGGQGGAGGGTAGGGGPANMPSEQGGSFGPDDAPDMTPGGAFDGNPMEGCVPQGLGALDPKMGGGTISEDQPGADPQPAIPTKPESVEGPNVVDNIVGQLGQFGEALEWVSKGGKVDVGGGVSVNLGKTVESATDGRAMLHVTIKNGTLKKIFDAGNKMDPEGGSGNANICPPGYSLWGDMDCDEDCEDSDKNAPVSSLFGTPSTQDFSDDCDDGIADVDKVDKQAMDKYMNKYVYDPPPVEFNAIFNIVDGLQVLTGFSQVK